MFRKSLRLLVPSVTALFSLACILFTAPAAGPAGVTPSAAAVQSATSASAARPTLKFPPDATSLNPIGPYVMFSSQNTGIWISNPDGTFLTHVSPYGLLNDLGRAISPAGNQLAQIVQNDQGLDLLLIKIPGGQTQTIAHLISISRDEETNNPTGAKALATYAIRDYNSLAWQPGDGRYLAFMAAIKGPTSDLYLYDTQTRAITQLTNGPSQAIMPEWSSDGQYILHFGVSWVPPFGGAIVGPNRLDGVWSVRVSDGKVISLPKPKGTKPNFVDWLDATHYLTYDSDDTCFARNLRSVDIVSGKTSTIMSNSFDYYIARSPDNGALMFSSAAGCPDSLGDGTFLLLPGQSTPTRLLDKTTYEVDWLPQSKLFDAYPEALFSTEGASRYDPPVYDASFHPAVSENGFEAWEVIQNQKGRVVLRVPGGDWKTILDGQVTQLIWDPFLQKTLLIALQDGSLYAAPWPDFKPALVGNLGGSADQAIWMYGPPTP